MPRPARRLRYRLTVLAIELAGIAAILGAVAYLWWPLALMLGGGLLIAVANNPERVL